MKIKPSIQDKKIIRRLLKHAGTHTALVKWVKEEGSPQARFEAFEHKVDPHNTLPTLELVDLYKNSQK